MSSDAQVIGFAGLGIMGSAASAHLLAAGVAVLGYDPDPDRADEHRRRGGAVAASPFELGRDTDVIVTSLPSDAALHALVSGHDLAVTDGGGASGGGLLAGFAARPMPDRVVIDTSTLRLAAKTRAALALAAAGATLLDCPLSGTGQQARQRDLAAYLSGDDPAAKARACPVLERFTRTVYDVGPFGNGMRMKLVANLLVAVHNVAAAEALLLAERVGLDLDDVLEFVGAGAGGSRMLDIRGPLMAREDFDDVGIRIATFAKDLALIAEFAAEAGSPTPLFRASQNVYAAAARQGRGEQDTASVFAVLKSEPRD